MQEPLEIRLLGPFEVLADGIPADVGGSKRQALLAMLALRNGRVVGVDMLIDGLWGAELPSASMPCDSKSCSQRSATPCVTTTSVPQRRPSRRRLRSGVDPPSRA
jgi:hypothetical protein